MKKNNYIFKDKVLILGNKGTLGKNLFQKFKKISKFSTFGLAKSKSDYNLNLENFKKLENLIKKEKFDIIVNCAAYTDLIYCEKNYQKILKINTFLPIFLSSLSLKSNFKFIHISTDHIYVSRKNIKNKESDKIGWHNKYSKSKYLAEKKLKNKSNTLIIRTNFIDNKKNKKSFLFWLNILIKKEIEIPLFTDMYTSTIDVNTLCDILIKLIKKKINGTYNVGSKNCLSKKEFALKYFKKLNINPSYKDMFTNDNYRLKVKRGRYLGLNINKIEKKLKIKMPNINKVLKNLCHENIRN